MSAARENWGSKLGVILAVIGSAVGLGNFLRFPGVACANGGGAFMIPYIISFLILGLPIAWVEWALGRYAGRKGHASAPGIFREVASRNRFAAFFGVLALIIPVIIYMYYVSVEAWCLGYAWNYWTGGMAEMVTSAEQAVMNSGGTAAEAKQAGVSAANGFLLNFAGVVPESGSDTANLRIWREFSTSALPFLLVCFVVNFVLIYRGLNKGIEWFCRWAMPALIICAVIILIRVLTLGAPEGAQDHTVYERVAAGSASTEALPELRKSSSESGDVYEPTGHFLIPHEVKANVSEGMGFMWNPVGHRMVSAGPVAKPKKVVVTVGFWEAIFDPQTWLAAAGQIFFSLSVGLGVIITYAAYTKSNDDIALCSLTAASGNGFFEVALGGMIVIPAAFIFMGPSSIVSAGEKASSLSLGFFALPGVFEHMPSGHFFGGLFFFLLFLAAVTSSLSMLQPAIAFLEEGLGLGRKASVSILGLITGIGACFVALVSSGLTVLDHMDFWTANLCIFLLATFEVILFAWVFGLDKGLAELAKGAEIPIPAFLPILLKYVTPVFLIVIFTAWLWDQIESGSYFMAVKNEPLVQVTLVFIGSIGIFFALLVGEAINRWTQEEEVAK
ncbi:MAG: sodium:calcium symporter [Planctomycetes bacterium]|nr:sodium:calcium symporter [Planctomycetota bacterium]